MKRTFSLAEVFVCLAIVGILASLLLPAILKHRNPKPPSNITWELVDSSTSRIKTPTGWLVRRHGDMVFIPDTKHEWLEDKPEAE